MKPIRHLIADARRHRGLALIIVLSMLALATIVILAFLSVAETEHKATTMYSSAQTSRRFADTAVNMVIAQIRSGSAREVNGTPVIHATQPGAVRKYAASGNFMAGYKLFSDQNMIYRASGGGVNQAESDFVRNSEPPADWNLGRNKSRYVDLNEPVIKGVSGRENSQTYFPIIDPRAAQDGDAMDQGQELPIEGFSYETRTALKGNDISSAGAGDRGPPILKPSGGTQGPNINSLRLAMPVQWLYVLKDGAVGYLHDGGGRLLFRVLDQGQSGLGDGPSVTQNGVYGVPSDSNPIVGRVAFWTDDETTKININTASEPTFAGQPLYYHERDRRWANYPPARFEYQRFPGHPATVALSSVLYPNPLQNDARSLDTYGPSGPPANNRINEVVAAKEGLYRLIPKINEGGSQSGTRTFEQDKFKTFLGTADNAKAVDIAAVMSERLYASVDELLFDQGSSDNGLRILNKAEASGITFFNKTTLERSSAFLTAHSRGSEINLFGLPRIAMWPLPRNVGGQSKRTGYDNLIEFCARLGPNNGPDNSNLYIFQRQHAQTTTGANAALFDISIARNQALLSMLDKIISQPFPTANHEAAGTVKSFKQKLGQDNARQVLVSMFDYIRCTNLYDSFLLEQDRGKWDELKNTDWALMYRTRDNSRSKMRTYTPVAARNVDNKADAFADRFFPAHGQVTPSVHPQWKVTSGGKSSGIRGFGRFITVSEIGLQFICTADGQPDMYSWRNPIKDGPKDGDTANHYKIPELTPEEFDMRAQVPPVVVSGGRTALMVNPESSTKFRIQHGKAPGLANVVLTNLKSQHWADPDAGENEMKFRFYSNYPPNPSGGRYGVVDNPGVLGSDRYAMSQDRHPGYQEENWNYTLPADQPLKVNEKMIQSIINLELFCPSVGYTEYHPDFTIVAEGLGTIEVNDERVFNSAPVAIRSRTPLYDESSSPEVGGFASFRNIVSDRRAPGAGLLPADTGYGDASTSDPHDNLLNLDLVSKYFKIEHGKTLQFVSGPITLKIYDRHVLATTREEPVQTITFRLRSGKAPAPDLVVTGSYGFNYIKEDGQPYNILPIQAPRWWGFNRDGVLNRTMPVIADENQLSLLESGKRGRLWRAKEQSSGSRVNDPRITTTGVPNQSLPGSHATIYTKDPGNFMEVEMQPRSILDANRIARIGYGPDYAKYGITKLTYPNAEWVANYNKPWHFGTDTIRSIQPSSGDVRLIASKVVVDANEWTPHRMWDDQNEYSAHNFSSYNASEAGFDRGSSNLDPAPDNTKRGLPIGVNLGDKSTSNQPTDGASRSPDAPHGLSPYAPNKLAAHELIQRYYDFDESDPGGRIGPYINKPDEGIFSIGNVKINNTGLVANFRTTYFRADSSADGGSKFANARGSYFTPNRMVPSPVIMGSLPSRMWDANANGAWTNLLFRPYVALPSGITGSVAKTAVTHPGEGSPPDHYLLDLFWMPVVEPYAISESLSSAGKINLNYQMLPFTHIRRATAIHAAMKSEIMAAMPNKEYGESKRNVTGWGANGSSPPMYQDEANYKRFWHRSIAVDRFKPETKLWWELSLNERVQGTLRQFEERFNFGQGATGALPDGYRGGLFRTASQLCEIHLIPNPTPNGRNVTPVRVATASGRKDAMAEFWGHHASTGDNTKERPYANLYAKFTTRSNTFRVHVRSQSIQKATRSVAADEFDPDKDQVGGEFRGSFLLERYIDQADMASQELNYATASNPFLLKPLESYYRFRVLESKRFAP